jgi:hypothetical protein
MTHLDQPVGDGSGVSSFIHLDGTLGSCMGAPPIPFCAMGGTPIHG